MKILHCCLAAFYIDNYGYQENILPKMHKSMGLDVAIVASTETFLNNKELGYVKASGYLNENNIPVTRLAYVKWIPHFIGKKLRIYKGLSKILDSFSPDIIFIHDVQFLSIIEIKKYIKRKKYVKIYVDGHTDFINSATNWISKNIMHRIIYRWCAKQIEPYVQKFWGVTPLRVDFYVDVYGIDKKKADLLVMGIDDSLIDFSKKEIIRKTIRTRLNLATDDFVIITGGKIDAKKNIILLMRALQELNIDKVKMIIFGTVNDDVSQEFEELLKWPGFRYMGWINSHDIYDYFFSSDLAVFPGTHSVLWEQAVGIGLPTVFKRWQGMEHIDVNGNCLLLDNINIETLKNTIYLLYSDKKLYSKMQHIAINQGIPKFSYYKIAKRAIDFE